MRNLDETYDLVGQDGNAFALMGYTSRAMQDAYRQARRSEDEKAMEEFGQTAQKALMKKAYLYLKVIYFTFMLEIV